MQNTGNSQQLWFVDFDFRVVRPVRGIIDGELAEIVGQPTKYLAGIQVFDNKESAYSKLISYVTGRIKQLEEDRWRLREELNPDDLTVKLWKQMNESIHPFGKLFDKLRAEQEKREAAGLAAKAMTETAESLGFVAGDSYHFEMKPVNTEEAGLIHPANSYALPPNGLETNNEPECKCMYPEIKARNMNGHDIHCPVYIEWAKRFYAEEKKQ